MAAIIKIELWKDVGFIDGAVEIPNLSAADPVNPDLTIEPTYPIIPSKERMFSEFKLKEYFSELMTCSYMRITYLIKNSLGVDTPKIFYGWITDVVLTSDAELPVTTISWHIDEWRTWKSNVTFGSGHIKRRPFVDIDTTPIQNYDYRYLEIGSEQGDVISLPRLYHTFSGNPPAMDGTIWWVIFTYNETYTLNGNTYTTIRYGAFPIKINSARDGHGNVYADRVYFKVGSLGANKLAPSLQAVRAGMLDEYLGLPPDSIIGVWLSPYLFKSGVLSGAGDLNSPLTIDETVTLVDGPSGSFYAFFTFAGLEEQYETRNITSITPSEENRYVVLDFEGSKLIDLPYGMTFTKLDTFFICETDTIYLCFSFRDEIMGRSEGCMATVPLPQLPINENAFSSYVYSGQRDYDRDMRTVTSNANAWKSAASGGSTGALFGAVGPIGALAGLGAGAAPGLINYGVEMLYQNDSEQALTDRLKSNQIAGLLMGSNCILAIQNQKGPTLVKMKPDSYSLGQIANTRAQFGVSVDELSASVDTLIRTSSPTGYYNIQNLIVSGDIPVSAKRWIRNKFASGVRLI